MSTISLPQTGATLAADDGVAERRRSRREAYVTPAWLSAEAGTKGAHQQVVVFDLSLHGVGFTSDEQLEVGATHWVVIVPADLRFQPPPHRLLPGTRLRGV